MESGEDSESLRSLIQSKSEEVAEQDLVSESNWQDFELEGSYTAIQIIPEGRFDEVSKIVLQKKMYIPDLEILRVYKNSPRLINLLLPVSLESVLIDLASNEAKVLNDHLMMKIAFGVIEGTVLPEVDLKTPEKIYNSIIKKYKPDIVDKILKTTPWLGMTLEMVIDTFGLWEDSTERVTKKKKKLSLFYPGSSWIWRRFPSKNRLGNNIYTFRIDLEDDVVVGWKNGNDV